MIKELYMLHISNIIIGDKIVQKDTNIMFNIGHVHRSSFGFR